MGLQWRNIFLTFVRPVSAEFIGTCFFVFLVVCTAASKTVLTPLVVGLVITGVVITLMDISMWRRFFLAIVTYYNTSLSFLPSVSSRAKNDWLYSTSYDLGTIPATEDCMQVLLSFVVIFISSTISDIEMWDTCGAHVNPVVTLAIYMAGGIKLHLLLLYVFSQLSGAILGAAFAKVVLRDDVWQSAKGGSNNLGEGVSVGVGIFTEILITTNLLIVILVSAVDKNTKSALTSIAIGIAVATGIFATDSVTGGSMNPARSFGPAVVGSYWEHHYVYWVGPIIGCLLASFLYHLFLASPENIILFKRKNKRREECLSDKGKETEAGIQMTTEQETEAGIQMTTEQET